MRGSEQLADSESVDANCSFERAEINAPYADEAKPVSMGQPPPVARRRNRPRVPARARESFLEALAAGYSVTHAAARTGIRRQRFYERREQDAAFAAAWNDALQQGTEALEDEARRRAVDGWEEPIYQRGDLVGHVHRYSDHLLMFLLKARDPARFRESVQVNAGGEVTFVLDSLLERARRLDGSQAARLADVEIAGELDPAKAGA